MPGSPCQRGAWGEPAALAAAALLFVLLALPGIAQPYGGFLGFSEAWYALVAQNFATGSLWLPMVAPDHPDFNIPPLFAWLLHAGFTIAGPAEWVARLVAIAGGALGVLAIGRAAGVTAALLLASTPSWVLLGRNVQPDGWAISLAVAAWAAWRGCGRRPWRLSAVLFGAALLAKPTVLVLPFGLLVAALLEQGGVGWVRAVHLRWASVAALPLIGWTSLQLALHPAVYLAGLRHGEGAFEVPDPGQLPVLASEVVHAAFPVVTVLAALAIPALRREPSLRPPAVVVATGLALFTVMHYHGYYLLACLPAAAMLAASVLRRRPALAVALVALNAFCALLVLGGHKLGRHETAELARAARGATFVMSPDAHGASWTLIQLYGQPRKIEIRDCVTRGGAPDSASVIRFPPAAGAPADLQAARSPHAVGMAGWALVELPANPHRLAWGPLALVRAPGLWLGLTPLAPEVAAAATLLPPGGTACP